MPKCPDCKRALMSGSIDDINGLLYQCTHCGKWFKEENDKMVRVKKK